MSILDRLMSRGRDGWINPSYPTQGNQSEDGSNSSNIVAPQETPASTQVNTNQLVVPENSASGLTSIAESDKIAAQPTRRQDIPGNPSEQNQISQGEGVVAIPEENGGISGENVEYLKGLGIPIEDIQSAMGSYSPDKGGFFQQMYESSMSKPRELYENRLRKMRNGAALTDALGLVAQLSAAVGGGDARERKFAETASGVGASSERDLREVYRQMADQYDRGLYGAASQDYQVGYNKYLANRKAILSALENKRKSEHQINLENLKNENATNRITIQESGRNQRNAENNKAKRYNLEYTQGEINVRAAKDRSVRQHQYNKQNSLAERRLAISKQGMELAKRREERLINNTKNGGRGASRKAVTFSVPDNTRGSHSDGVGSYVALEYTPNEYQSVAARANDWINGLSFVDKRSHGIPDKLSESDKIRFFIESEHPDQIGLTPIGAGGETGVNAGILSGSNPASKGAGNIFDNVEIGNIPAMIERDLAMMRNMPIGKLADMAYKDLPFKKAMKIRQGNKEPDDLFNERIVKAYMEYVANPESWNVEDVTVAGSQPDDVDEFNEYEYNY